MAGEIGFSPYRLRRAVEAITPVLGAWLLEESAPEWVSRLHRQCKRYLPVLETVPPLPDEVMGL